MSKKNNDPSQKNKDIITDVTVSSDGPVNDRSVRIDEDIEQIGKDIVVGCKEVGYEDGRNVISVIINAISVRINMPRGTVKALLACLAVLLIAVVMMAWDHADSGSTADTETETPDAETQREYAGDEESRAVNSERPASGKDYVIISSNFRYTLPDGFEGIWEPDDYYEENEIFCDFTHDGNPYTIRSYLLQYSNNDLADIVKASLSQFDGYKYIDEEYIDGKYGKVLKIRFEETDYDGTFYAVTGYYWSDYDPHICCLEVSSDEWREDGVEEMILDSVYRVSTDSGGSLVPSDADEIWQEQQKEEAMNSLIEDAMNDYYQEQEPDSYPW